MRIFIFKTINLVLIFNLNSIISPYTELYITIKSKCRSLFTSEYKLSAQKGLLELLDADVEMVTRLQDLVA